MIRWRTARPALILLPWMLLACACIGGCNRDDKIVTYQAPKEQAGSSEPAPAHVQAPANAKEPPNEVGWTVPDGWRALPGDNLRYAAFAVSADDPNLVVTVIPLGPNLPMLANINRWEGQIGLPPSDEAQLSKLLKRTEIDGTKVDTLELVGAEAEGKPKQMILAAILERPDKTWYVKLQGPADKVAPQREKFDAFVKSIRFGNAPAIATNGAAAPSTPPAMPPALPPAPAPAPPAAQANGAQANAADGMPRWAVPAGWTQEPAKPMRVATYKTSDGAEVILSSFGAEAFKDKLANINRWRNMLDLPPVEDPNAQPADKISVGGLPAALYRFENKELKLVVVTVDRGETVWFVRVAGPTAAVDAQKKNLDSFLNSFQW